MAKKKKKTSWYKYGGRPSDMKSLIPKANFGQTLGTIGDTNMAKHLDMVVPGLGTGLDIALDTAGFFGDKKEYKDLQEQGNLAGEYKMAIEGGTNKGNLNFSSALSGAEMKQKEAWDAEKPNIWKELVIPTVVDTATSAASGGLGEGTADALKGMELGDTNMQELIQQFTGTGTTLSAFGGAPKSDIYEAEGNEVIQHEPGAPPGTTGQMNPIGNNPMLSELKGKSHASGGELVDASGQQVVYSTKLKSKVWGVSFADAAKKIGLKIESFEKAAADGDHITKQTAQSMIRSWMVKLQELQAEQENARKEKFTQLLQDGSSFEELSQNFPDLTQQFMAANSQGPKTQQPTEAPMSPMEQQFLYGGKPKYAYGSPDPNDPPFYETRRTDEDVDAMQDTFMTYNGHKIYGNDQGIKDYIEEIGMDEFARQWMANMDPELLGFAGIQEFGDLFENNGEKLKMLQTLYNEKNAGQPGFTPIPVDSGIGKFGEHSMSMAGWKDLEDAATNPDGPISGGGDIPDPNGDGGDGSDTNTGTDTDPELEITELDFEDEEEEEEIVYGPDGRPIEGTPEERERWKEGDISLERQRDDMAPIVTGDPTQDWGYEIKPDPEPEIEFEELDLGDDDEEEDEDVNILPISLTDYQGVKLPPNNQKNNDKKTPPPYMGDAPYTDIVADNAGVQLEPGPGKKPPFTGGYFTGQDDGVDDIVSGTYDPEATYFNRPILEDAAMYRDDVEFYDDTDDVNAQIKADKKANRKRNRKRNIDLGSGKEDPFNTGAGDGWKSKNRWWERDPNKKKKKVEDNNTKIEDTNNIIDDNTTTTTTDKDKANAYGNRKFFQGLSKYMSPMYNLLKANEGAETERKQVNPYEDQILKDMDQRIDIQPWLNQNMMAMKGGIDHSKDFASGNPMQMFSMYNRLNQGKMMQDSAAWKYKHDAEGKLKTARSNMMFNLGERDRAENIRVAGVNSENRAAVDKHISTAIEQLSAIGQLDEYTANLMENDKLRASFINAMAPDLQKYMNNNPDATLDESIDNVISGLSAEDIQSMIDQSIGEIPINVNITPADNTTTTNNEGGGDATNNEIIDADDVLGGGDFVNPLDQATNNVQNVGTPIDVGDDMRFTDAYSAELNGNLFTPIEGESNRYTYNDQTYVKIKQGDSELFISEQEATELGLLQNETTNNNDIDVDMNDVVLDGGDAGDGEDGTVDVTGDGAGDGNNVEYTPVISSDEMTSLQPMSIQSTGAGAANILENGQPIQVEIDGGTLKVNGVRAEGDKIVVDGSMTVFGADVPATRDFGEFIQDSNSASGFKWVPNPQSWKQFQDNASAEQKAMFASFIKAVEGDIRYAEALRNQISGGEGTLTGAQLNDTIRNKPE